MKEGETHRETQGLCLVCVTVPLQSHRWNGMAKKASVMRLVSQAGTGYFYTFKKAAKAGVEKCAAVIPPSASVQCLLMCCLHLRLKLIKFDPRVNARVLFVEEKIKKGKKGN